MFALTFSALRLTTVKSSLFDNVAFVGNPCPQIYIPTKNYTSICLSFIKIILNLLPAQLLPYEPGKFWLPMKNDPPQIKVIL